MLLGLVVLWAISGVRAQSQQPAPPKAAGLSGVSPPPRPGASDSQNPPAGTKELPSIRVLTGLVHLVVTVTDHHRNFITDLDQKDFKVLENGTAQEIRFFGRETDLPLRIGLLLDTSNSIRQRLQFEQEAAIDFLNKVIRRNKDMAFLMTFDNEPEVIQDYTENLSLLTDAIRKQRAGGGTALDDAIYRASEMLSNPPLPPGPNPEVRRVIVVISDGDDNLSDHALSEAITQKGPFAPRPPSTRSARIPSGLRSTMNPGRASITLTQETRFCRSLPTRPAAASFSLTRSTTSHNRSWILEPSCAASTLSPILRRSPFPRADIAASKSRPTARASNVRTRQGLLRGRPDV